MGPDTRPEAFTWAAYRELLRTAASAGYRLVDFGTLDAGEGGASEPALAIRHDVDYVPHWAARMAALEQSEGARSTYCLQPDSLYYSLDAPDVQEAVGEILRSGHWLGLHLDATGIPVDDRVVEAVVTEADSLAVRFDAPVRVVSFHMPGRRSVGQIELPDGLVNTYSPRFFDQIGYLSDSNMNWRGEDPSAVLSSRRHRRLQLLIHPFWWREESASMLEKLEELAADLSLDPSELISPEQREILD
jgi:hypothetical protein